MLLAPSADEGHFFGFADWPVLRRTWYIFLRREIQHMKFSRTVMWHQHSPHATKLLGASAALPFPLVCTTILPMVYWQLVVWIICEYLGESAAMAWSRGLSWMPRHLRVLVGSRSPTMFSLQCCFYNLTLLSHMSFSSFWISIRHEYTVSLSEEDWQVSAASDSFKTATLHAWSHYIYVAKSAATVKIEYSCKGT